MDKEKFSFIIKSTNNLSVIKYVAYIFTENFYVLLKKKNKKYEITLQPKKSFRKLALSKIKNDFNTKLKEEILKHEIYEKNKALREFLIKKAILEGDRIATEKTENLNQDITLTKEEKKELEKIIKEVEKELKTYDKKRASNIAKTWEEVNAKS